MPHCQRNMVCAISQVMYCRFWTQCHGVIPVSRTLSRLKECSWPLLNPEDWHGNGVLLLLLLEPTCQGMKVLVQADAIPRDWLVRCRSAHPGKQGGWSQPRSNGHLSINPSPLPPQFTKLLALAPHHTPEINPTSQYYQIKLVFFMSRTPHFLEVGRLVSDLLTRTHPSCPTFPPPTFSLWDWGKAHCARLGNWLQRSHQPSPKWHKNGPGTLSSN